MWRHAIINPRGGGWGVGWGANVLPTSVWDCRRNIDVKYANIDCRHILSDGMFLVVDICIKSCTYQSELKNL